MRIYMPTDASAPQPAPVVVISHGNGHDYTWYDYLGEHFASWGYVVLSHRNDTVPGVYTAAATSLSTTATFLPRPPAVALLHMLDCPAVGGDTMFINSHAVYDSLSPAMQAFLGTLSCVHDDGGQGDRRAEHPVVRAHPETGRPSLFVHKQFSRRIPQLSRPESQMLLGHLFRWQEQVRFSCRWRWSPGDVVLWDERNTLHAMVDDTDGRRELMRATVLGDEPVAFAPDRLAERFGLPKTASSGFYGIGSYEF